MQSQVKLGRLQEPEVEIVETSFELSPPKKVQDSIRLVLRGPGGLTTTRAFARATKIAELLEIFLTDHGKLEHSRKASIEFDGERLKPSSTIADLVDLEEDDALDVKF